MTRRFAALAAVAAWAAFAMPGAADANCVDDVASARLIGSGRFCVFAICLYDAQLWARRAPGAFDTPFALSLAYRHDVKGERLVATGMDEIERLAAAPLPAATRDAWRRDIARAFTNVSRGDVLCGVYLPERGARFYTNGRLTAEVADPAFARAFFEIWLDPRTRATSLHRQLLGDDAR
ncbi:TPA: chalcone isomerase family protein [Burkholderia vietnamiensis]|nr:chalcone isomerase family protein [Burkholderia vietnamiensis]HDR8978548.1 chalcone isomerase family protein [Burkholderia vietnamiensis]